MHINKEGRAGRCTGSEERGNAFVSGRLMVRDPRVSYDADSSLVNDYDNSTGSSGTPSRGNCRQPRRQATQGNPERGARTGSWARDESHVRSSPKINELGIGLSSG